MDTQETVQEFDARMEEERKEMYPEKGSFIGGFIGAVLGGLVASIPWVVVAMLGYVVAYLGALIALGANLGHKILGGKQGKGRIVTVVLVTIVMVFAAQSAAAYLSTVQQVSKEASMPMMDAAKLVNEYLPQIVQDSEARLAFFKDLGIGYVFAAIGLFSIYRSKLRNQ